MIVSHKHKFIFVKTKKTAGTSIDIALSRICGNDDILTIINAEDEVTRYKIAKRNAQNNKISFLKYRIIDWFRFVKHRKRRNFYSHMPASLIKHYIGLEIWNEYFTFCFERHPVSKSISHYSWRSKEVEFDNFESYLNSEEILKIKGDNFYKDAKGNYLVDKVYKMEEMAAAFEDIANKIGIEKSELPPPNFKSKETFENEKLDSKIISSKFKEQLLLIFKTEFEDFYEL
jgi:hypothetical protein